MRLKILAIIAMDPLFEIIRTRHPPPWARTLQVHFSFGVKSPYTSLKRAPFRPASFGFTPLDDADRDRIQGAKKELDKMLKEDEVRDTAAMVLSQGAGPAKRDDGG